MESVGVGGFAIAASLELMTPDGLILTDPDGNPLMIDLRGGS